jgi:hypothetical protein
MNKSLINIVGVIVWIILFYNFVPISLIKKYPLILVGFVYVIFIILTNYLLIGDENENTVSDYDDNIINLVTLINRKAIEVSTATFAIALATKDFFKIKIYKYILLFMIYTLIFGVGIIAPVYIISNVSKYKLIQLNTTLITIRNVSLSYSIGFMISTYMLIISRIFEI